jgi:DNA-binding CsgD family transcriptional regulator
LALVALGDSERARELSSQELALADASGVYGNIGVALMAHGLALGADSGITWLERAVEALERSPRVIARVEALLALGSMIRRTGRPRAARAHLTKAVDLARRHGARSLCERARVELQAAGGRPRREALTGIEALTASERRVADLAASGLTNRRIAQELFLSPRTVTTHLTHVYQKLGVSGRDQLSDLLEP